MDCVQHSHLNVHQPQSWECCFLQQANKLCINAAKFRTQETRKDVRMANCWIVVHGIIESEQFWLEEASQKGTKADVRHEIPNGMYCCRQSFHLVSFFVLPREFSSWLRQVQVFLHIWGFSCCRSLPIHIAALRLKCWIKTLYQSNCCC